jgi:8-oxo-dGTP pyrophosphatase MutT (NUDIX family)
VKWIEHGRRPIYQSDWVSLWLDDVETPDGERFEHHVVRVPKEATSVAVVNHEDSVLMLWRHRFIIDQWGWELPSGWVNAGEAPEQAARREVEEETGWQVHNLTHLGSCNADNGLVALRSHLYLTRSATYAGPPQDTTEADRVEWVPMADVPKLIKNGHIQDAPVMVTLLLALIDPDSVGAMCSGQKK